MGEYFIILEWESLKQHKNHETIKDDIAILNGIF